MKYTRDILESDVLGNWYYKGTAVYEHEPLEEVIRHSQNILRMGIYRTCKNAGLNRYAMSIQNEDGLVVAVLR